MAIDRRHRVAAGLCGPGRPAGPRAIDRSAELAGIALIQRPAHRPQGQALQGNHAMKRISRYAFALLALCTAGAMHQAAAFKPTAEFGHVGIVRDALARISVRSSDGLSTLRFSERAILQVRDATAGVDEIVSDRGELTVPTAHCDDELLPECSQRIIDIKNTVISLLTAPTPDGDAARRQVGRALHTLQDFFAHSNWINISSGDPGLGTTVLSRLGPTQDTCERGFSTLGSGTLAGLGLSSTTTGYFSLVLAPPEGKCNHGLGLDPGIHKDEPSRTGHGAARAAAVNATEGLIRQILGAPGIAGNDRAIRAFLDVRGAVGFVVDTTGSMGGVIAGVKTSIGRIVNAVASGANPPDRYILVGFNDPSVSGATVTADAGALLSAANGLFASGGGDCPELAMTGALRAVNAAPDASQLYLFTDASAKDAGLAGNVITQARAKQISISFLTFGSCSPIDPAYYAIAAETGGQLYELSRTTAETEKIFGLVNPYVIGTPKPVFIGRGAIGGTRNIDLPIDPAAVSLQVSAAVNAGSSARLFDPSGREIAGGQPGVTVTPVTGGTLFAVSAPAAGTWRVTLTGTGSFDLSVTADSPIELNRFQFVESRGRDGHTGLFAIKSQPLAGAVQQSRATVLGVVAGASFRLVSEAGIPIMDLPATNGGELAPDEWSSAFQLPGERFRVQVSGTDGGGKPYLRTYPQLFLGRTVKVEALGGGFGNFAPGLNTVVRFLVTNLGATDSFAVTAVDERGFIRAAAPATATLAPNQSRTIDVPVVIPANAVLGTTNNISLSVQGASTANGSVFTQIVRATSIAGDLDNDGDVDRDDIAVIFAARNQAASGPADPRDVDGDGRITVLDARKATLLCTRPACKRE
ncbi:VWA domain-containing protein [Pelomonas sp. Root1444]|uniref:VWA domain-containing protein n=1 Tax=Pelomonas sp. Root1444 TaxID=1736464 RepID=UPI00138F8263|nr:VWA domain-containing protein [Pelomonas sp. Root1444]